jgi:alpha-tubulin suppressor-like RCC1 family protein
MSVAIGPSGRNDIYLFHLHEFLSNAASHSPDVSAMLNEHAQDDTTSELANMVKLLQTNYRPYFLFGSGSNEQNQLLLNTKAGDIDDTDEVNELTEMLLVVSSNEESSQNDEPESIYAGGGHSALLTSSGHLYLWGWNEAGQLGRKDSFYNEAPSSSLLSPIQPLGIKVGTVSLGHTHTLVIEKDTKRLFAFGDNGRGQVTGSATSGKTCHRPSTPSGLSDERFIDISAGLFHSAAVTEQGELVTWGCDRFGQSITAVGSTVGRWVPSDGSKLVKVVCGRRHTVMIDEHGRVWSMGDNKYGQLGRTSGENITEPQLVDGPLGQTNSGCIAIHSGWSHLLALVRHEDSGKMIMFGWGRNDKYQLGITPNQHIFIPQAIPFGTDDNAIKSVCCGAESSHILDELGNILSTGWNEHGNLGIGDDDNACESDNSQWRRVSGANVVAPPTTDEKVKKVFAAGGAHLIVMKV